MIEGFLLINKRANMTSFRCVGLIKRLIGKNVRVGHGGTLDKFATGLLIIGIGRNATKHLGLLLKMSKTYLGTGQLGTLTDTLDPAGQIICTNESLVNHKDLADAIVNFSSSYLQTPPVYSALKFAGQRLSDLYRANADLTNLAAQARNLDVGQIARDKSRQVTLYKLELIAFDGKLFSIRAHVSSGTYIRVLINDIARQVNSCAMTIQLCRTKIGPFDLSQALDLENLDLDQINQNILPISKLQNEVMNDHVKT